MSDDAASPLPPPAPLPLPAPPLPTPASLPAPDERAALAAELAELARQEDELQLPAFDDRAAWWLGVRMIDDAWERGLSLAVDVRRHGQVLFHAATAGTSRDNDQWLARKRRVVELCSRSSRRVGLQAAHDGGSFAQWWGLDPARYAADGGAFPIVVRGTGMVGTVAVSGLAPGDDHAFAATHLRALLEHLGG